MSNVRSSFQRHACTKINRCIASRAAPQMGSVPRDPHQEFVPARGSSQAQGYSRWDNAGIRQVNREDQPQIGYDGPASKEGDDANLARQISVPRKQVGTSPNVPRSSVQPPIPSNRQQGHSRNQSASKPLPAAPMSSNDAPGLQDAQEVVNRAKSNTYDTTVIEKVAPGKSLREYTALCKQSLISYHFQPSSTRLFTKTYIMYGKSESLETYMSTTCITGYFLSLMLRCFHRAISCPWKGAV